MNQRLNTRQKNPLLTTLSRFSLPLLLALSGISHAAEAVKASVPASAPASASTVSAGTNATTASVTGKTASNAAATVAKIQVMLAKPAILCGNFEQSKQLSGIKKPLLATGRFCVVNGKGVLWRTLKPFPNTLRLTRDEIVQFQGERVAVRLAATQEPTVRMINSVLFSLLAGDLSQLDKLFEIDGSVDSETKADGKADSKSETKSGTPGKADASKGGSWQVALKAREPALARAIGTIALDGGAYVKHISMQEASGDRTNIVFSGLQSGEAAMLPEEVALLP